MSDKLFLPREQLLPLVKIKPWRTVLGGLRIYLVVVCALIVQFRVGIFLAPISLLIIGACQHALSILFHEVVHGLFLRNKRWNDTLGSILFGYPILLGLSYRTVHLRHHKYIGTDDDPDYANYKDFPASVAYALRKALREYSGYGAGAQFFGGAGFAARTGPEYAGVLITQAGLFLAFSLYWDPSAYVLFWLLPLATVAKGLAQTRNVAEHVLLSGFRLRTFNTHVVDRFLLGPFHFTHHAEHHVHPTVPYYFLPELRERLAKHPEYLGAVDVASTYGNVLRRAIKLQ